MDHYLDRPITEVSQDLLGYQKVAGTLLGAIEAQPNRSSLTLGLDGAWGSGKSSILEMLQKSVQCPGDDEERIGTVVVPFSPWLIGTHTALVSAFFAQLTKALTDAEQRVPGGWRAKPWFKSIGKKLQSAKEKLNRFSNMVSIASTAAAVVDPTLISAALAGGSKAVSQLSKKRDDGPSLEDQKRELTDLLVEIARADPSFRILVLIDDLDRLDPNDALEVLRLVKAIGDFPATTYLLAYDRSAIGKAIQHSAKVENGDVYLEKIIQFSFKVPPLEPFQLRNWLFDELGKAFPEMIDAPPAQVTAVNIWAGRLLKTPRDVKRLLFAVRAVWPTIASRANLLDLVWLQIVALKASDGERNLYAWVVEYLQGLEAIAIGGRVVGAKQQRANLISILEKLGWGQFDSSESITSTDFHSLDEILAGITQNHIDPSDDQNWIYKAEFADIQRFRAARRLSSPWHWRLYFALDVPSSAVTDDEWNALVEASKASTDALSSRLAELLEFREGSRRHTADQIMDRAGFGLEQGNLLFPGRWLIAVIEQAKAMEDRSRQQGVFKTSKQFRSSIVEFARLTFKAIDSSERSSRIEEVFGRREFLVTSSSLLAHQIAAAAKSEYDREKELFLTASELKRARSLQLGIFASLTPQEFRSLPEPFNILFAWKAAAATDNHVKKFLNNAMSDDVEFLETLSALKTVTSSEQNDVPHIPEAFLANFIDAKSIKQRLDKLASGRTVLAPQAADLAKLWWNA